MPSVQEAAFGGSPVVVRILRGDRAARDRLIAALGAGDAEAERAWQTRIARLVDAITARAIEDGYLDLPEDDTFWSMFPPRESREIVAALSALGFRFDGAGGFADERIPAQRDLSLAVGYAGLDRMRIRNWPREQELAELYRNADVAADEWLAHNAGDLTLGEMVDALGPRAGDLADVWNAWGRVRPRCCCLSPRLAAARHPPPRRAVGLASRLVLLDHDDPQRLGGLDADRGALLARPTRGSAPRARSGSRIWLAWARSASILRSIVAVTSTHGDRLVRPEQVQAPDPVRLEAVARQPRERHARCAPPGRRRRRRPCPAARWSAWLTPPSS